MTKIDTKVMLDMHCVDGWSVVKNEFEGVRTKKIVSLVNAFSYSYISLISSGDFKSFIFSDDVIDSFVCLRMNGKPLGKKKGFSSKIYCAKIACLQMGQILKQN